MKLLDQKRIGLIIRAFNTKPELVEDRSLRVISTIKKALELSVMGRSVFRRIDVLIPIDPRYSDCDCGETASCLRRLVGENFSPTDVEKIKVSEVAHGDVFVEVLNYGISRQLRDRIDISVIISSGVNAYLTPENMQALLEPFNRGARVAGIAIDELAELTMKGRIANTFAAWDTVALGQVGMFDLRAAKPAKDDKRTLYLAGWSDEKAEADGNGEVYYHRAGVEEIIPLIRLGRTFGPCIAPVKPVGEGFHWVIPDPIKDPEGYLRHLKKIATKQTRQEAWMYEERVDPSFLEGKLL